MQEAAGGNRTLTAETLSLKQEPGTHTRVQPPSHASLGPQQRGWRPHAGQGPSSPFWAASSFSDWLLLLLEAVGGGDGARLEAALSLSSRSRSM